MTLTAPGLLVDRAPSLYAPLLAALQRRAWLHGTGRLEKGVCSGNGLYYESVTGLAEGHAAAANQPPPHTAVVLHGLLGSGRNLRGMVAALCKQAAEQTGATWRGLLVDLRNHGKSAQLASLPPPHDLRCAAHDVVRLVQQQLGGRAPEALIGHSMGGKTALEVVRQLALPGAPVGQPKQGDGAPLLVCKGALEETVSLCCSVEQGQALIPLDDRRRSKLLAVGEQLNAEGMRVLAVAVRQLPTAAAALQAATAAGTQAAEWVEGADGVPAPSTPHSSPRITQLQPQVISERAGEKSYSATGLPSGRSSRASLASSVQQSYSTDDEAGMTFVGFLAFLDPPKETARQAVQQLQDKAVQLKVLTGDSLAVACSVCSDVGIPTIHTITGPELAQLGAGEFCVAVQRASVMGKLTPGQKARVVAALKGGGHTVGFLGDGVNDALALRAADVGVSVDTGSDIAKEAADVILLEKSLLVLEHGVSQGRETHGECCCNTSKYIKLAASSNFGNVFSILVASAWLPFQPMHPIQLLTQNLLYDLSQTAVPFDRVDASYLAVPRTWSAAGLGIFMLAIGPVSSIFDITTFCLLWFVYGANSPERQALFQTGWFTVGLLTQTLIVHMIRTERIPFVQEVAAWPVVLMTAVISGIGLVLPYTPVGAAEGMVALPLSFYGWVAATIAGYMLTVQLAKWIYIRTFCSWL